MKRVLIIIFAGVFILPRLCESFILMEAKVDKHYEDDIKVGKHIHNSDSVSSVESGVTSYDIPATGMASGVYQVTLIEGGVVTGMQKFTK